MTPAIDISVHAAPAPARERPTTQTRVPRTSGLRPVASNQDAIHARRLGDAARLAPTVAEPCDGCGTRAGTRVGASAIAASAGDDPGRNALRLRQDLIQAKLAVSQPGEPSERAAEQVARQVIRMPERPGRIRWGAADAATGPLAISVRSPLEGLGGGQPLPRSERTFFEPRFGRDLSAVRIHADATAASMARSIKARAFTSGNSIAFAPGELRQDDAGRILLAHELAHVVQNASGDGRLMRQGDAGVADAGVGDARPAIPDGGGNATRTRVFNGVTLSDDPAYTNDLLQRMFLNSGFWAMHDFVYSFESDVSVRRPVAGVSDDPEVNRDLAILSVVKEQYQKLADYRDSFIGEFESHARAAGVAVVSDSERIVMAEAVRYGVRNLHIEASTWLGIPEIKGDVADNASTRGLAIAARGLLDRKKKAEAAVEKYEEFTHGMSAIAELASSRLHSQEEEFAAFRSVMSETQKDLDVFRIQVQIRYPILAALSSDEDFKRDDLEDLAAGREGPNKGVADVVVAQVVEKLANIAKVKEGLKPGGDINLWLVPKLVAATRDEIGVAPGTLRANIFDEKLKEEQPSALTQILIGVLQLGLVLLAPLTEGLTLIPAAAISAGTAYAHFKEYETKSALRGTHFGAGALSAEEPSLFWLAADIVGAGFDVGAASGAALRIFRELAPAAKALRAGEVSEDAVRNLERHASDVGGKPLAEAIGRDARALRSGAKDVGITAEEARQFEQVGTEFAGQESRLGAKSAETFPGGHATVTRSGAVWSCQSPCVMMREQFKDLFAREPNFLKRLDDIEERAAKAAKLAEGTEADLARQGLADEAAALEREMRTTLVGERAAALADLRTAYGDALGRRPALARDLEELETQLAAGGNLEPRALARVDEVGARLEQLKQVDQVSAAPRDARILEVSFDRASEFHFGKTADIVPNPPIVLEFPDGSRVWRDSVGGPVRQEATLGGSIGRSGFERAMYSQAAHGRLPPGVNWERAHALGQGTGFESPYALWYAPEYVNQTLQNNGIEKFMRQLVERAKPDETYRVLTSTAMHGDTTRLARTEYTIVKISGDARETVASYAISVGRNAPYTVTAAPIQFANTPAGTAARTAGITPEILLQSVSKSH